MPPTKSLKKFIKNSAPNRDKCKGFQRRNAPTVPFLQEWPMRGIFVRSGYHSWDGIPLKCYCPCLFYLTMQRSVWKLRPYPSKFVGFCLYLNKYVFISSWIINSSQGKKSKNPNINSANDRKALYVISLSLSLCCFFATIAATAQRPNPLPP